MKVIIILLTTFALLATLGLAQSTPPTLNPASSTSICSEEKSFGCLSNERYVEYVMPMDRSTETDRCPRRPKKIKNSDRAKPLFWFRSKPKPKPNGFWETETETETEANTQYIAIFRFLDHRDF